MEQDDGAHARSFEQLYIKERKKTRIFMASTGIALVLTLGSLVYAANKKSTPPEGARTLGDGGQMTPLGGGPGGNGNVRMQMDVTNFLNDDGSVDTEEVQDMLDGVPDDFRENMLERIETQIDEALSDGEITADQATALKSAFGITGDTDES